MHGRKIGRKKSIRKFLAKIGLDDFLIALLVMIALAYFWPEPGVKKGPFSIANIANYGISGIFFFYGLRLSPEKLRAGLSNWKLHFLIQLSTFVIFPLVVLPFYPFFKGASNELLWLGTFYLAALPSTVSSSVVMVSVAGGNIPAAIFNASISSLLGVFITPLWMGLFLSTSGGSFDIWVVFGKLILQVLFPVIVGIALYSRLGAIGEKYKKQLKYFDQSIILMIVYTSFSESFAKKMFAIFEIGDIFVLALAMLGVFFLIYGLVFVACKVLAFKKPDRITALFCGSKKSLVQGTVMSKVLFTANSVGIILLPIMLYHALQLIVVSILAQSMGEKAVVGVEDERNGQRQR